MAEAEERGHSLVARQKAWGRRRMGRALGGALSSFAVSGWVVVEYQGLEPSGSVHGVDGD